MIAGNYYIHLQTDIHSQYWHGETQYLTACVRLNDSVYLVLFVNGRWETLKAVGLSKAGDETHGDF